MLTNRRVRVFPAQAVRLPAGPALRRLLVLVSLVAGGWFLGSASAAVADETSTDVSRATSGVVELVGAVGDGTGGSTDHSEEEAPPSATDADADADASTGTHTDAGTRPDADAGHTDATETTTATGGGGNPDAPTTPGNGQSGTTTDDASGASVSDRPERSTSALGEPVARSGEVVYHALDHVARGAGGTVSAVTQPGQTAGASDGSSASASDGAGNGTATGSQGETSLSSKGGLTGPARGVVTTTVTLLGDALVRNNPGGDRATARTAPVLSGLAPLIDRVPHDDARADAAQPAGSASGEAADTSEGAGDRDDDRAGSASREYACAGPGPGSGAVTPAGTPYGQASHDAENGDDSVPRSHDDRPSGSDSTGATSSSAPPGPPAAGYLVTRADTVGGDARRVAPPSGPHLVVRDAADDPSFSPD